MATIEAPAYVGWDQFHRAERRLYQKGKTHRRSVIIDETGVAVDIEGATEHYTREALGDLAPSYQFPPYGAVLDGFRIVRWLITDRSPGAVR